MWLNEESIIDIVVKISINTFKFSGRPLLFNLQHIFTLHSTHLCSTPACLVSSCATLHSNIRLYADHEEQNCEKKKSKAT